MATGRLSTGSLCSAPTATPHRGTYGGRPPGRGFDVALGALDYSGWDSRRLDALHVPRPDAADRPEVMRLLSQSADPFFLAELVDVSASVTFGDGYAILIVTSEDGQLSYSTGSLAVQQGAAILVPYAAGPATLEGHLQALPTAERRLAQPCSTPGAASTSPAPSTRTSASARRDRTSALGRNWAAGRSPPSCASC